MNLRNRVYIPRKAHSNQYVIAEIKPDEAFYQHFGGAAACYETLRKLFFLLAESNDLRNVHFIANDKLPVIRYHSEYFCFQTEKQMLFFYNPRYHEAQSTYLVPGHQARKIRLLFLATGEEIRANSSEFHKKVSRLLQQLVAKLPDLSASQIKVRDHQHLSYDLFSGAKGNRETYAFKLRSLYTRYEKRHCNLPRPRQELNYVTVTLPVSRRLKQDLQLAGHDYGAMYQRMADIFFAACESEQLTRTAVLANGKAPIVRNSQVDPNDSNLELQKMSFDPTSQNSQRLTFWEPDNLVETVSFIIVAGENDAIESGYGGFVNRTHNAFKQMASEYGLRDNQDDLIVRFYQHISYLY